ncbi:hypothetical protein BC829DRAFT_375809 [Chytridium lagenaria]|nr:hypothetical protein BC829DRAFT_375809 [Chytridium lagenaria]
MYFFREVAIRGADNVPDGPVVFVIAPRTNLSVNRFVDPIILISNCRRTISFLTAKASYDRQIVGWIARGLQTIPVIRPQDLAVKGKGTIHLADAGNSTMIRGIGTRFLTELSVKAVISVESGVVGEVLEVLSDTEVRLVKGVVGEEVVKALTFGVSMNGAKFKVTPHVDQGDLFGKVADVLDASGAVGIFPEGGSHDRPHLLPLKAGVAIMALSAMAKNPNLNVKIVPVGLQYFHPHRFRSRAVVQFGAPIEVKPELLDRYCSGGHSKREAVSTLMDDVKLSLKSVTVEFPDFETMMVVTTARKLFNPKRLNFTPSQICEHSRRFARGYLRYKDDPRVAALSRRLLEYNARLEVCGIRDADVERLTGSWWIGILGLLMVRVMQLTFFGVLALPGSILNAPIMVLCEFISRRKARDALAHSTVKLRGNDVIATWKILVAAVAFPLMHILLSILVFFLLPLLPSLSLLARISISLLTLFLGPAISYAGVRAMEVGLDVARSINPLFRALVRPEKENEEMRRLRRELQEEVAAVVAEYGPVVVGRRTAMEEPNGVADVNRRASIPSASPTRNGEVTVPIWNGSKWFESATDSGEEESDGVDVNIGKVIRQDAIALATEE